MGFFVYEAKSRLLNVLRCRDFETGNQQDRRHGPCERELGTGFHRHLHFRETVLSALRFRALGGRLGGRSKLPFGPTIGTSKPAILGNFERTKGVTLPNKSSDNLTFSIPFQLHEHFVFLARSRFIQSPLFQKKLDF
jgi:hypothetical protein